MSLSERDRAAAIKALDVARRNLVQDPHLANYVLRDLEVTKQLGLDGTAWAAHRGTPSRKDVEYIINKIAEVVEPALPVQPKPAYSPPQPCVCGGSPHISVCPSRAER